VFVACLLLCLQAKWPEVKAVKQQTKHDSHHSCLPAQSLAFCGFFYAGGVEAAKQQISTNTAQQQQSIQTTVLIIDSKVCAVILQEEWPEDEAAKQQIRADFSSDDEIGDRRQELVFIGQVGAQQLLLPLLLIPTSSNIQFAGGI
jgi:hypothetical protein